MDKAASHAYGDAQFLVLFVKNNLAHCKTDALRYGPKAVLVTFGKQDGKFLAAEPCHTVIFPHDVFQGIRKSKKHLVPAQMSVSVVEMLEKIYVDYEHPGKTVVTPQVADCLLHPRDEKIVGKKPGLWLGNADFVMQAVLHSDREHGKHPVYIEHFVRRKGAAAVFLAYVDDCIDGIIKMMESDDNVTGPINLGNDCELTMNELAQKVIKLTKNEWIAIICIFITVCIRSYVGMILAFTWKSTFIFALLSIFGVVLGKMLVELLEIK